MTSLTIEIALRSLDALLAGPNTKTATGSDAAKVQKSKLKVRYFHKVLFRHKLSPATKSNPFSLNSLEKEANVSQAPQLYLCLCLSEIVLVDPNAKWAPYRVMQKDADGKMIPVANVKQNPNIVMVIPYQNVTEVVADTLREEVFGLGVESSPQFPLPYDGPLALRFSTSFRKQLVEDLQICHNVNSMIRRNRAVTLPVRFAPLAMAPRRNVYADPMTDNRLATFQFFSQAKLPPDTKHRKIFYRSEYIFLGPESLIDRYEALPNRPCSTYIMVDPFSPEEKKQGAPRGKLGIPETVRLIAKFLPPRNLSDMGSITRARDVLGQSVTAGGEDEDLGVELSQAGLSELEFQFWVESIAQSLAMNESSSDQYFIPEKGTYFKKLNIVSDKASWTCFRVHVFTRNRQIGVIGCRRRYLPPFLDCFQDMLFVLYGPARSSIRPEHGFMPLLEGVVDSLSPAVAPLPFKEAEIARGHPEVIRDAPFRAIHPTYADRDLIQARADTLLYTSDQFRWLATREWLRDPTVKVVKADDAGSPLTSPGTGGSSSSAAAAAAGGAAGDSGLPAVIGVVPRTKFIDVECWDLATKFCDSVAAKLPNTAKPTDGSRKAVADPLAIIFRMMAELDQDEEDLESNGTSLGPRRNVADTGETHSGYTMKEEWKCRVANYFAYCIDGGVRPNELTLIKLASAKGSTDEKTINEVVDFLLYMKQKSRSLKKNPHGFPYVPFKSVIERISTTDILNSFTCNEDVLIKLLLGNYFETASQKASKPESVARLFRSVLVTKLYNLRLVQVVCEKIASGKYASDEILVDPLVNLVKVGNFYVKAWAFKALAALAQSSHESAIFERGGVGMAIWTVYTSRTSDLIEAALDLLIAVTQANKLELQPYVILTQPDLARKLIQLLAPFAKTEQQERYHPRVLERIATLIIKLAPDARVLSVLIENGAHNHLSNIVQKHTHYHQILVKVTNAIGTIYLSAGSKMSNPRYSPRDTQESDAMNLVSALKEHNTAHKLQLCLNILIILHKMLNFFEDQIPVPNGALQNRRYLQAIQDRMDLYYRIRDVHSFDVNILPSIRNTAIEVYRHALHEREAYKDSENYATTNADEKRLRLGEFDKRMKIAKGVVSKCDWFEAFTAYCKTRSYSAKQLMSDGGRPKPLVVNVTDLSKVR